MASHTVNHVYLNDTRITVEVADTPLERASGMSNRMDLDADAMLFVYDELVFVPFTATNCPIALDLGFFDADGVCLAIRNMAPFRTGPYWPPKPFCYALEFPAGRFLLIPGDRLRIESVEMP